LSGIEDSKRSHFRTSHYKNMRQQDETEKQLTKIWEEVLGVKPIRRDQSYFQLGGTSLLAVCLFARIEETFNVELPMSTLIEAPTISDLGRILDGNESAPKWSPLVELQRGGSRPPFFCVHGAGGNVLIYRDLARQLGPDQPVYGLQSQGLDGKQPVLTHIEDMASLYISEIRRVQSHGPYLLGGYCMGGTIALEMAERLKLQGEEVALLALFDTINWGNMPALSVWGSLYHQLQRLLFHAGNFLLLTSTDKIRFFQEKLNVLRSRVSVWRGMLLRTSGLNKTGFRSESSVLAQVWETNDSAVLNYLPRPYAGVITDFRPMKQYARYAGENVKWARLSLGQQIITLPVYPAGMLLEPFVKHLAAALSAAIDGAAEAETVLSKERHFTQISGAFN
jgi:phthiocerol/phenolphthiocerol synthesis type-I polyketide synthase E